MNQHPQPRETPAPILTAGDARKLAENLMDVMNALLGIAANSISRSMMVPLAMRPTVGTPRVMLAACPSAWKPPIASEPCATA
jgi:hypothetical protein